MTDIIDPSAPGNGASTTSRQKFRLLEKLMGDSRLSDAERRVGYFIIDWYGIKGPYTFTRHDRLAERAGVSEKTVQRAVARLVALGYIFVKTQGRHGRASEYVPVFLTEQPLAGHSEQPLAGHSYVRLEPSSPPSQEPLAGHSYVQVAGHSYVQVAGHSYVHPNPTTPVVTTKGVVGTDADALAPDGARARVGEAASESAASKKVATVPAVLKQLLSVWQNKPAKSVRPAKGAIAEVMARADAPSTELLVAKAREYVANVPAGEQRWLHIWLQDEGWLCDERPRSEPRASKANGKAKPAKAPTVGGVGDPDIGRKVWLREETVVYDDGSVDADFSKLGTVIDHTVDEKGIHHFLVRWPGARCSRVLNTEISWCPVEDEPVEDDGEDELDETPEEAVAREAGFPVGAWVWERQEGRMVEVHSVHRDDDGSCTLRAQMSTGVYLEMPICEFTYEDPNPALRIERAKYEAAYKANEERFPKGSRVNSVDGRRNGKVLQPRFDGVDVLWEGTDRERVPAKDLVPV
jgi:helix-turn-helix protein